MVGLGGGAILRGSLAVVIATAGAADRAAALATFFTAAYIGLSLPVLALGVALQYLSPQVTLLIFAVAVAPGPRRGLDARPSALTSFRPHVCKERT